MKCAACNMEVTSPLWRLDKPFCCQGCYNSFLKDFMKTAKPA